MKVTLLQMTLFRIMNVDVKQEIIYLIHYFVLLEVSLHSLFKEKKLHSLDY